MPRAVPSCAAVLMIPDAVPRAPAGTLVPSLVFQLMETSDPELLDLWRDRWADLCDFEVVPVIKSDEAARRTGVRWDTPGQ
jgi:Domain of unknown function (DUF3303)